MAKQKYRAANRIEGLLDRGRPLELGEDVALEEKQAEPFVACGALVPLEAKAESTDEK